MERFISRDPFESDKRVETNWWIREDPCEYCRQKDSRICDYCWYKKRIKYPVIC